MVTFSHIVVVLAISVVVLLPASTMAAEYVVGGDSGWTTDYNYTAWAQGKVFYVGDKLVFNYPKDAHDVYKVDAASFASCTVPPGTGLTSGNDVVTLMTSGKKWYICGVGNHCAERLQKLVINVEGMTPAPAPSSATKYAYQSFQRAHASPNCGGGDSVGLPITILSMAQGKVFYVGDKLVFNYPKDVHDVYKVDAASFASCTVPPGTGLTSGKRCCRFCDIYDSGKSG
ncbi:putative cupredoxin [Tanacetum coccineum]